jgi:hypothetical protein
LHPHIFVFPRLSTTELLGASPSTSSEQYFSYIQDENRFNNIKNLYRNEGMDGSTASTTFDCYWKSMESLIDKKNVVFCSSIITYSFYIRGFYHAGSVVLSKEQCLPTDGSIAPAWFSYAKHDRPNLEQLASSREITRSDDKPKLSSNVLFIIGSDYQFFYNDFKDMSQKCLNYNTIRRNDWLFIAQRPANSISAIFRTKIGSII